MLCDYDTNHSERSYPFELIVAESKQATNYDELGASPGGFQPIKWYTDTGGLEEFNFDTPINGNITLYGNVEQENQSSNSYNP